MTEVYKLLFDLSLFYTVSGYYFILIGHTAPSVAGFLALAAAAGLDALLRARSKAYPRLRFLPLLLPLLALFARPTLLQCLQCLPAWVFLGWSTLSGRVDIRYDGFREHFSFGLKLLLLMVFGPLFQDELANGLLRSIPFFVLMLTVGVCLLRMLRENRPEGLRQGLYMSAFVLLCAGLTLGRAPQLLVKAFALLYRTVLAPLIFVLAIALAALGYGFYLVLRWLVDRAQGSREPLRFELQETAEMLGLEEQYSAYTANLEWLRILLIVLAIAALLFLLWRVFRRLLGERTVRSVSPVWQDRRSPFAAPRADASAPGRFRPRDPRRAVRYYYAKFLAECSKRGRTAPDGMTATERSAFCAGVFPGADPAALVRLYAPARYSARQQVTPEDAQAAAALWKDLKQSKPAGAKKK